MNRYYSGAFNRDAANVLVDHDDDVDGSVRTTLIRRKTFSVFFFTHIILCKIRRTDLILIARRLRNSVQNNI